MSPLILAAAGAVALYAVSKRSTRAKRVGKSGNTWYTVTIPGSDPGSVGIQIYDAPTGGNMVLSYNQVNETGQRFVTFQAPSTSGQAAAADFI